MSVSVVLCSWIDADRWSIGDQGLWLIVVLNSVMGVERMRRGDDGLSLMVVVC